MLNRFFARHSFKVILIVLFMLPILARGARKAMMSNDNDVHDWLPDTYDETVDFAWFQQHFENETFVLISWDGCTLSDERLELLARKLVPPEGAEDEHPNALRPTEGPKQWYDDMFFSAWLKRPEKAGRIAGAPLFKGVQTGPRLMDKLTKPPIEISETEAKKRLQGLFVGPDGLQSCAVVTLTDEGKKDLKFTLDVLSDVTQNQLALPASRVRMGGPPVDNVAISREGEKTLMRLLVPAGIVGVSLAFWCLRSIRLTMMVFSTALYAGAVSLALVHYSGNAMNAILLTMPAVVYVAGISGAIHFSNYYRDSVATHGVEGAPARALLSSWLPCTLSGVTTAAGLISLYTSELLPIRMFGIFSAAGVVATLFLLFLFLPAWMQLWPMRPHSLLDGSQPRTEDVDLPVRARKFLEGALNRHRLVLAGLLLLMVVCGIGLTKINTSIKLTKLFSPSAQIIHDYTWLEEKLGPLVPMEVVIKIDPDASGMNFLERMEMIREIQDKMLTIKDIGNTMSATTFAPSLQVRSGGIFNLRSALSGRLEGHRQDYENADFLDMDGKLELWRISARVGALNDVDYGEFKNDIRAQVEPVLESWRRKMAARTAQRLEREKAAAADSSNGDVRLVAGQEAIAPNDAAAPTAAADNKQGLNAIYTGLVPVVYKAQREMLKGLAWNFLTDLLTIAAVMTIAFRDLSAGLILLIPSVFPLVIVFGIMGWMGVVIDVGTIMTPTVALGVSVDDVVHFLIWYRRGLAEGMTRKESIMLAYKDCARAMYQSWAVLGLGLAVFALSSFVPTQRFGAMMFTLLTAALVGNILLLPAVLASPLSYFFGRKIIRQAAKRQSEDGHAVPLESSMGEPHSELVSPQRRHDTPHKVKS